MDYGERFNYGKIKDDFDCPKYSEHNGYYSSTHTSSDIDSTFNPIPSLDDLQEEYPDKFKTFHNLITYRGGKGNKFFATYGINKFGKLELLDTNWYHSKSRENMEIKEENERLKEYIIFLEEKNDVLEKCNETISKENKKLTEENQKETSKIKRKAKAFDELGKLLYSKIVYNQDYQDVYASVKGGSVKVGQRLEGESVELTKLTDKEIIKLLNLLLMGMGSEYYVEWLGYTGLKDKDDKEEKVTIRE
jgi:thiol-disulfide isomerase/thioredoxin